MSNSRIITVVFNFELIAINNYWIISAQNHTANDVIFSSGVCGG